VAGFFAAALGKGAGLPELSTESLAALDSALDRLDADAVSPGTASAARG
jgi:hypothetical protein